MLSVTQMISELQFVLYGLQGHILPLSSFSAGANRQGTASQSQGLQGNTRFLYINLNIL